MFYDHALSDNPRDNYAKTRSKGMSGTRVTNWLMGARITDIKNIYLSLIIDIHVIYRLRGPDEKHPNQSFR